MAEKSSVMTENSQDEKGQVAGLLEAGEEKEAVSWEPKITALVCNWCTYAGADMAGTTRMQYAPNVRLIRLPCTGRVDPLFIMKAFEQGADAVLVSGCHPGDCHYVQGNLLARRRFTVFRHLMEFVGLDLRRLHFAWVSAAEGAKWKDLVNQVTEEVKQLAAPPLPWGVPSRDGTGRLIGLSHPDISTKPEISSFSEETYAAMTQALRSATRQLLEDGEVGVVVGYGKGSLPDTTVPVFIAKPEDADRLVLNENCVNNLSVYLTNPLVRQRGRVGVVAKGCDVRAIVNLVQENQVGREDLVIVGVECARVKMRGEMALKCYGCEVKTPNLYDHLIKAELPDRPHTHQLSPLDAEIAYIDSLPPQERWDYWQRQFARCIRCYACRAVCPMCYCKMCITDCHRPQWIPTSHDGGGNMSWNVIRAMHLAGRCIGCNECYRACPAHIRLDLINRKLALIVEKEFGYRAGLDAEVAPPLTTFRPEDKGDFIR